MSFLTPLYLLGALAVSLPILFHMIRRTPRDRREFSSVMFLQPSPPKITRRSRVEHWLLLFLRALAVCLLALAFARPFVRQSDQTSLEAGDGRAIVVLLDRSASMRREGLWDEALKKMEELLTEDVTPADQVSVLMFDDQIERVCSFDQWSALDASRRAEGVLSTLSEISPTWRGTRLGDALIEAAELLDAITTDQTRHTERTVIVLSDLQSGSRLESLQTYDWPKAVGVSLLPVGEEVNANNAGIQLVADSRSAVTTAADRTRVRVTNVEGADREEFTIRWVDEFDQAEDAGGPSSAEETSVSVIVPAGHSRIIRAARRQDSPGIGRLVLAGDHHDFDNTCYVPPPRPRSATVAILSDQTDDDPRFMRFYLPAALTSLPGREVHVVDWEEVKSGEKAPQLTIVLSSPSESEMGKLRRVVQEGGTLLYAAPTSEELDGVFSLLEIDREFITESPADEDDYAMLTGIDFEHPLFTSLAEPRFSDFTKVRFWKHRLLPLEAFPQPRVLARFDNGDPAVIEVGAGDGRIIVFAAGWHPADSQLAISTKFVPMLNGLVDDVAGIVDRRTTYHVGEAITLAEFDLEAADVGAVRRPDGEQVALEAAAKAYRDTLQPGIYTFLLDGDSSTDDPPSFAVNLIPAESQTSRLPDDALVSAGVILEADQSEVLIDEAAQRQLRAGELESRQKLWRWLVVALIVLLIAETLLASRTARRQLTSA